jgi:2-polyprenyl-6-methoxyphenol hydroxylase-like FAD-dependent oxidoreductase
MNKNAYEHAVVIGGSIAGLVSAAVLSRHFERVTILERDRLPENIELRKGVPQGTQPHILLKGGQMILEQLFPGFTAELEAAGAVSVNMGGDLRWFAMGTWRPRFESSVEILGASRPLIEATVRRHLAQNPKITFIQEASVKGLATDADNTQVIGVDIDHRFMGELTVAADLVVDASGRGTHAPEWFEALGFEPPAITAVNAFAGYSARYYEVTPGMNFKGMYVQPSPLTGPRGAVLLPNEGNRWHVALIGIAGDYPPNGDEQFLEFARSLPTPEIYNILKDAKPLGHAAVGFRKSENRMYHYEQLPRYLENFVAIGDAVFAFNPVYGQGMSVAAVSALDLDKALNEQCDLSDNLIGLAERFQKALGETLAMPWQLATGEDLRWQATEIEGYYPPPDAQAIEMGAYMGKVFAAANRSTEVLETFIRVQNMIESPAAFFSPDMMTLVMEEAAAAGQEMMAAARNAAEPEMA